MKTREELGARVRAIISDHLARHGAGSAEVKDSSVLAFTADGASLELDSLDLIEITMEIEDALDIELNDELVSDLATVADLTNHIAERVGLVAAEDGERCLACSEGMKEGDRYYNDVSGGVLHADCAGPEREGFVKDVGTGEPLGPGDPIPQPQIWASDVAKVAA